MIGSLRGTVVDRSVAGAGGEVIVEAGGVGYRLTVPTGTLAHLDASGREVFLHVHTSVREDAIVLYGFATRDERVCFEALVGTHGVGPGLALAILSVHAPAALRQVLAADDVDALTLVPGVGRKTAARLLVELKGRLDLDFDAEATLAAIGGGGGNGGGGPLGEVRAALAGLGYGPDEIRQALAGAAGLAGEAGAVGEASVQDILRAALRALGRGAAAG